MQNIYELSEAEAGHVAAIITAALMEGKTIKVCVDGGLKIKGGGGMWSPPLGKVVGNV